MVPPPGTEFSPLCNGCILLRGVAYHNRREPKLYRSAPTGCCPMLRTRLGMRVFRRLRRISPVFRLRSHLSTRCISLQHYSSGETVPCVRQVGAMKTVFGRIHARPPSDPSRRWPQGRRIPRSRDRVHRGPCLARSPSASRSSAPSARNALAQRRPASAMTPARGTVPSGKHSPVRVPACLIVRLAEFGGAVEFGTALGSFEQSDEGVSAVIVKGGQAETVTARWWSAATAVTASSARTPVSLSWARPARRCG
jgi:hypothetical protein